MRSITMRRLLALLLAVLTMISLATEGMALSTEQTAEESVQAQEDTEASGETAAEPEEQTDPEEDAAGTGAEAEETTEDTGETSTDSDGAAGTEPEQDGTGTGEPETSDDSADGSADDAAQEQEQTQEEQTDAQQEEPETEVSDDTSYELTVASEESVSLTYDDRYSFSELAEGYVVVKIRTEQVTSYQVSGGDVTSEKDTAVLTMDGDSETDVIAAGVGTATVWLVPEDQAETAAAAMEAAEDEAQSETAGASETAAVRQAQTEDGGETAAEAAEKTDTDESLAEGEAADGTLSEEEAAEETPSEEETADTDETGEAEAAKIEVSAIRVKVTVEPAKLTLMLLAGQSNMEGTSGGYVYRRQNSVLCPEGEVYATYAPSNQSSGWTCGGISNYSSSADTMVAGSLTGTTSRDGTELDYAPNALTEAGGGKTGPDSGLAYEWNRLTGDKVWVVNAAWTGTGITVWEQGGVAYARAAEVFEAAIDTLEAEIAAGHYTEGNRLLFWQQGEYDRNMSASDYTESFLSMKEGMTQDCGVEYFGLIIPRDCRNSYTDATDIYMSGPRIAQYYMGSSTASEFANVYVVSNVNEQWISDSGVESYFSSAYPGGSLTYPLRSSSTLTGLPTTVDAVHPDKHYTQVGHNENGLTAARNLYYIVKNKRPSSSIDAVWKDSTGQTVSGTITLTEGESYTLVPVTEPLCYAKKISVTVSDSSVLSYDAETGQLLGKSSGTAQLQIEAGGSVLQSLTVEVQPLATPTLQQIANQSSGVQIKWSAVTKATGYRVYRRVSGGSWSLIATVSATSYTDTSAVNGTVYTYTVRAYNSSKISDYDRNGLSITYLTPTTVTVSGQPGNVKVTWKKNSKAGNYLVYRRTSGGSWTLLQKLSATQLSYTDTTAVSGVVYEYTVRVSKSGSLSAYTAVTWAQPGTPVLSGAQNTEGAIVLSWKKDAAATGYRVYRKTEGTSWTRIATISGNTTVSYQDTDVKNQTAYTYTVTAVRGSYASGYDKTGCTVVCVSTPTVTGLENKTDGVKLSWKAVSGAGSYLVYRKTSGGSWSRLGTAAGTSYTDTTAKSGTTYFYTLRAVNQGTCSGYRTAGYSICCLAAPKISALSNTSSGLKVTWGAVTGATGYRVYRKTSGGSWSNVGTATGTSYTDTTAKSGTTYTYTVRAVRNSLLSDYDHTGKSLCCLSTPTLNGVQAQTGKLVVSWKAVTGAASYRVYRKTSGGSWSNVGTVTGTSYTDTTVKSGTTYTYTVRAVKNGALSDYNRTGVTASAK